MIETAEMQEIKSHPWLIVNGKVVEAECSVCHQVIYVRGDRLATEDQENEIREAVTRHALSRHRLDAPLTIH